jgi:hypothetical protein
MTKPTIESVYRLCIETRNFEVNQLVARNNFFMVFQGVLFAGLAQASASAPPIVSFGLCAVGVASSLMQAFMASGAKFWQERWEASLEEAERDFLGEEAGKSVATKPLFSLAEPEFEALVAQRLAGRGRGVRLLIHRFSVSRLPIYAGYMFTLAWALLLLCTVEGPWGQLVPAFIVGFPK